MGSEIIKILRFIISVTKVSNYTFNSTGDKLSIITSMDLLKDSDMATLARSRSIKELCRNLDIIAQPTPEDCFKFMKVFEGRMLLKLVLENSTFTKTGYDIEQYLDETVELLGKMSGF